ncbi:discoidin domain-containing receptor 2-like [Tigriopus californicus]|uniref:discoidin domain-containing receptor 2-like n=1 Tax=Tigriopus californicus TaxID=6832 RepID=UPI0027D9F6C8|nr:discoidin domain-containing receptor 2-like [Tigriopus californicus]
MMKQKHRWPRILLCLNLLNPIWALQFDSSCNVTLGLESGTVDDTDMTASSSFDHHSTGPQNARLNVDVRGGAWCPKQAVHEGVKEWIQVDLKKIHIITGIVTQGRYGKGKGREFVENFMIEYKRPGLDEWKVYSNQKGKRIFQGNSDTLTPRYTVLDPPIFGSHVRIIPHSIHPRIVCLRLELHGCLDQSGILAYSSPSPDLPGTSNIALDNRQEWWSEQDRGILNDGYLGQDVLSLTDVPSYDQGWMGWKRKGSSPIELIFEFDAPRNFSFIHIFISNRFEFEVSVFKRAQIWFSVGGEHYLGDPVTFEYMPDKSLQESRNVSIGLNGRVGRFVKVHLVFEAIWILVSEITFESTPVNEEILGEGTFSTLSPNQQGPVRSTTKSSSIIDTAESAEQMSTPRPDDNIQQVAENSVYLEVIIGVLTAVTLLLLFLFIVVLWYSRRQKLLHSPTSRSLNPFPVQLNMKDLLMNFSTTPNAANSGETELVASSNLMVSSPANITTNPNYMNGTTADEITTSFYDTFRGQPIYEEHQVLEDARTKWHSTGHVPESRSHFRSSLTTAPGNTLAMAGSGMLVNNNVTEYASVDIQSMTAANNGMSRFQGPTAGTFTAGQHSNYRSLQPQSNPSGGLLRGPLHNNKQTLPQQQHPHQQQVFNLGNYFPRVSSEPPSRKSYGSVSTNGKERLDTKPLAPPSQGLPMAQTLWNLTTSVQALCKQVNGSTLEEVPRSQLRLKESLGRGCFGEVLVCEIDTAYSNVPQAVAVRSCSTFNEEQEEFLRECRFLVSLQHPNIARLVGVSTSQDPFCSILEHSAQGDLYHFLRQYPCVVGCPSSSPTTSTLTTSLSPQSSSCSPASSANNNRDGSILSGRGSLHTPVNGVNTVVAASSAGISYHRLLEISAQIAAGMRYLESRNVVHKDLAARNCIVTEGNQVKISDVAMGISLFNSDYSEVRGRSCAPIRWQAWETILLGRVTPSSNVWTFAVTLWEILTLCRQRPFTQLTDVEVIQNAEKIYYNDTLQHDLLPPDHCEMDVWEMMEECWSRDEDRRPNFTEINLFLKRKSLSRDPHNVPIIQAALGTMSSASYDVEV